mgnify:CR=1 FL=1
MACRSPRLLQWRCLARWLHQGYFAARSSRYAAKGIVVEGIVFVVGIIIEELSHTRLEILRPSWVDAIFKERYPLSQRVLLGDQRGRLLSEGRRSGFHVRLQLSGGSTDIVPKPLPLPLLPDIQPDQESNEDNNESFHKLMRQHPNVSALRARAPQSRIQPAHQASTNPKPSVQV